MGNSLNIERHLIWLGTEDNIKDMAIPEVTSQKQSHTQLIARHFPGLPSHRYVPHKGSKAHHSVESQLKLQLK
jgi:hypothetical protein